MATAPTRPAATRTAPTMPFSRAAKASLGSAVSASVAAGASLSLGVALAIATSVEAAGVAAGASSAEDAGEAVVAAVSLAEVFGGAEVAGVLVSGCTVGLGGRTVLEVLEVVVVQTGRVWATDKSSGQSLSAATISELWDENQPKATEVYDSQALAVSPLKLGVTQGSAGRVALMRTGGGVGSAL